MAPPVPRRAPYKDFLQPALQRRLASTAGVVLGLAYIEALTLSSWNSFIWSWFPIGLTGLRALAIFACVLPLIILRIAHSHMGRRISNSPFDTVRSLLFRPRSLEPPVTYALSFWLFGQLYLLSIPEDANLRWITYYGGDRPRLNERAVFYTLNIIFVGLADGYVHMIFDYDRLSLQTVKPKEEGKEATPAQQPDPWARWLHQAPKILIRSLTMAIFFSLVNYIAVYSVMRHSAWGWAMSFFRWFHHNLPRSNIPPSQAPWSIWMLGRSIWASFLFCTLWDITDLALTLQLEKGPFKNGQPLTSESKDPNGSLVNGLKSKKPRVQTFAVAELAYIARDFEDRRKSIFEDIDGKDGPIWSQLFAACLAIIGSIEQRIDQYGKPPPPPTAPEEAASAQAPEARARAALPPKDEDVWRPVAPATGIRGSVAKAVGSAARTSSKTPVEVLAPQAKKHALEMTGRLLTEKQKEALTPDGIHGALRALALWVIRGTVLGPFFRQTFGRRLAVAVLSTPYGEVSVYANAAFALSQLAVSSLTEDKYGNVQRDVPTLIRTFTSVIKKLENFRDAELAEHWTDVEHDRECADVDALLDALKTGLGRLIEAFGPYSSDLRLSRADVRLAREAATKKEKKEEKAVNGREENGGAAADRRPEMRQAD